MIHFSVYLFLGMAISVGILIGVKDQRVVEKILSRRELIHSEASKYDGIKKEKLKKKLLKKQQDTVIVQSRNNNNNEQYRISSSNNQR